MLISNSSNFYESEPSSEVLEKLSETEQYLLIQQDFIEFQDWLSEGDSIVLGDENWFGDIPNENDFCLDQLFDEAWLVDELAQREECLLKSKTVLLACPKNMPKWENAWWGERAIRELGWLP